MSRLCCWCGFGRIPWILDCACGIGTHAFGLTRLEYGVTAFDISWMSWQRAAGNQVRIRFERADFCALEDTFTEQFDIVIAMNNALPYMLTADTLDAAIRSITDLLAPGGMFAASIRDYDALLKNKPPYFPLYIHETEQGRRVSFQTWAWEGVTTAIRVDIAESDASNVWLKNLYFYIETDWRMKFEPVASGLTIRPQMTAMTDTMLRQNSISCLLIVKFLKPPGSKEILGSGRFGIFRQSKLYQRKFIISTSYICTIDRRYGL